MKQFAKVLASFSLAATMCLGVGFAADSPHPGEHGTVDKAMVSEETDKAYDEKPNMGTKFNLYLAPDIPETVPPIKRMFLRWAIPAFLRNPCSRPCW